MSSFADVIKPEEAWNLVHFLRTLQPQASVGVGALEGICVYSREGH